MSRCVFDTANSFYDYSTFSYVSNMLYMAILSMYFGCVSVRFCTSVVFAKKATGGFVPTLLVIRQNVTAKFLC